MSSALRKLAHPRWDPLWAASLALLVGWVVLRYWEVRWGVPVVYDRDGLFHLAMVQNLLESGSWSDSPRTGAPFGGSLADFPLGGERLHWMGLGILAHLSGRASTALNLWLLLSFPLVAAVAQPCARRFGLGRVASLVVAVCFAALPYHFSRSHGHFLRVAYFGVPLGALACWWLFQPSRWDGKRWAGLAAIGVVLGCADTQHAIFTCVLFGVTSAIVALQRRTWTPLVLTLALCTVSATTLVVNNLPYLERRAEDGPNGVTAKRVVSEQERYGLRVAQLLLPATGHRIDALSAFKKRSRKETLAPSEDGQSLGLLASFGLVASVLSLFGLVARRSDDDADLSLPRLGVLNLTAILFATGGGLAYLLSLGGLTMLRTWNRISIFIAWFSLVAAVGLLEPWWSREGGRLRGPVRVWVGAGLVGLLALTDQTTDTHQRDRDRIAERWDADRKTFAELETKLGPDAAVFQVPYMAFPEPPDRERMRAYAPLMPYVHTSQIRWSYGGVKGRPEGNWQRDLQHLPVSTQTALLASAGFSAILLDRFGFEDRGRALAKELDRLGLPRIPGGDRRFRAFDLRPMLRKGGKSRLSPIEPEALAQAVPAVRVRFAEGFYPEEQRGSARWHWAGPTATVRLGSTDGRPHAVTLRAKIVTADGTPATLTAKAGQEVVAVKTRKRAGWLEMAVVVPPEGIDLDLRYDGKPGPGQAGDARELFFRVIDLVVDPTPTARRIDCWARRHDNTRDRCPR